MEDDALTGNLREFFFDKAQEALAIFDKELNFVDVNEALLKSIGFKRDQIIGKNVREISPGIEETERYKMYREVISTGKAMMIDEVRLHPSLGNYVSRLSIFKVGEGLGLSALNITDLRDAIDELETFSYRSSHDMRMPIVNILGLIGIAQSETKDLKSARRYLETIQREAERLDVILKKLVSTTTIRQGGKTINLIDFTQLVSDVVGSFTNIDGFESVRILVEISVRNDFYSDRSLLVSFFQNLIENAIKYRRELADSHIIITVSDDEDGVKIVVSDNGIGIAIHLQKNVFNIFFRATNQASGSGLGLYTVKHCIKKLGGTIKLESEENVGTSFTVYLPNEE